MNQRILIVDDEDSLRMTLRMRLQNAGFEVHTGADGEEALEVMKSREIDLVLLDINMPRMDGIETLGHITEMYPSTDVIMLTGFADFTTAMDCLKKGAKDYLVKPIETSELITRVRAILRAKTAEEALKVSKYYQNSSVLFDIILPLLSTETALSPLLIGENSDTANIASQSIKNIIVEFLKHLEISKAESFPLSLNRRLVGTELLLKNFCSRLTILSGSYGVSAQCTIESPLPNPEWDAERIDQLLTVSAGMLFRIMKKNSSLHFNASCVTGNETSVILIFFNVIPPEGSEAEQTFGEKIIAHHPDLSPAVPRETCFLLLRRIASMHNGSFKVESDTNGILRIVISLPA